jgi:hypothetical protein
MLHPHASALPADTLPNLTTVLYTLLNYTTFAAQDKFSTLANGLSSEDLADLTTLFRSLSIAYEQHRTKFSSEYIVQYLPKRYGQTISM